MKASARKISGDNQTIYSGEEAILIIYFYDNHNDEEVSIYKEDDPSEILYSEEDIEQIVYVGNKT